MNIVIQTNQERCASSDDSVYLSGWPKATARACPCNKAVMLIQDNQWITIDPHKPIDPETAKRARTRILLLPHTWATEGDGPAYVESAESVRKLFAKDNVPAELLTPITGKTRLITSRSQILIAPTLLVSSLLLTQNPSAVSLALNIIANYVVQLFAGLKHSPDVSLSIVQTTADGKTARELKYRGPAVGLPDVAKVLSEFASEKRPRGS